MGCYSKSSNSLDQFSIETYGDLEIHFMESQPETYSFLLEAPEILEPSHKNMFLIGCFIS